MKWIKKNKNKIKNPKNKKEHHEVNYLGNERDPDSCIRFDELEQDLSSNIF
jgi:hypothetical protein